MIFLSPLLAVSMAFAGAKAKPAPAPAASTSTAVAPDTAPAVSSAPASWPRVDEALKEYEAARAATVPPKSDVPAEDGAWVRARLKALLKLDQLARDYLTLPYSQNYGDDERRAFEDRFAPHYESTRSVIEDDLRAIFLVYGWPTPSSVGNEGADDILKLTDGGQLAFQKDALAEMEKAGGDSLKAPYAKLYDRVAAAEEKPQRFGTRGQCAGAGKWTPSPIEDEEGLDARRAGAGLEPMAKQVEKLKGTCR